MLAQDIISGGDSALHLGAAGSRGSANTGEGAARRGLARQLARTGPPNQTVEGALKRRRRAVGKVRPRGAEGARQGAQRSVVVAVVQLVLVLVPVAAGAAGAAGADGAAGAAAAARGLLGILAGCCASGGCGCFRGCESGQTRAKTTIDRGAPWCAGRCSRPRRSQCAAVRGSARRERGRRRQAGDGRRLAWARM